jgi:branched-chain amino acid transport system ATP-binding protein
MTGILTVDAIDVSYGRAKALAAVSIEVERGQTLAILGANGAGKSTLGKAIAGVLHPERGRIVLDGKDLTRLAAHHVRRAGLTYIPEGRGVFPGLSVLDNLRVGLQGTGSKAERADAIEQAFATFPALRARSRQPASTLSGGQQQMLALAPILAAPPQVLVADELSLGLAPMLVDAVFERLAEVRRLGVTIVLIEQFVHRALVLAEHAVILQRGRVSWRGATRDATAEVLDHYLGH